MLNTYNLKKTFKNRNESKIILNNINMSIEKGKWYSIVGPSGTGKTTLLNCLSGLLKPDEGKVCFEGVNLYELNQRELSNFRRKNIGFIFQDFKLLPHYTVLDNVMLPIIHDMDVKSLEERAKKLLNEVGIVESLYGRLPDYLSGGERQRVAIARSLIAEPKLLFCDEPTGNLDLETRNQITNLLNQIKMSGQTIIIVTHDIEVANLGDMCFYLKNGELQTMELMK
ncbi:ABC transporter ATP-binding protein [Bacillus kwashiorkori]|uniref:ABC transporter ATP-binding protein n=1 Tax=Bacillus kwashiorkori TaxID=1522318 RepID=UPI0007837912|nr:ABC transporter ATP-binding protein [Bacillus kwashiorkori]